MNSMIRKKLLVTIFLFVIIGLICFLYYLFLDYIHKNLYFIYDNSFIIFIILIILLGISIVNTIKLVFLINVKRRFNINNYDYYMNRVIISEDKLIYMDGLKYKYIIINNIKSITPRIFGSFKQGEFDDKIKKQINGVLYGKDSLSTKREYSSLYYTVQIIDCNNNEINFRIGTFKDDKIKKYSVIDNSFYDEMFNILKKKNSKIIFNELKVILLHWHTSIYLREKDFKIDEDLIYNYNSDEDL